MLVDQEKIRILIHQRTLHAMAFLNVQLPHWSNEGIIIRQNLVPSLLKRSRIASPLKCTKSSAGDLSSKKEAKKSEIDSTVVLGRKTFPSDFIFGAASSAYQIEGGPDQGGKGPSIWDTFSHKFPEKIEGRSTGDIACDSYNRYKDDVKLLKDAGMDTYRFSISWPRILPTGSLKGCINLDGIQYYNNLIDELIANGIMPFVTLFHWDTPQALEDEYGGFLDRKIVDDFKDFCEICFNEFGDRVKHWITFNEPYTFTSFGYDTGAFAPGRCSKGCPVGDSAREPYIASHNILLAHAVVYRLYREKYQGAQKGEIGITLNTNWIIPFSSSKEDVQAAERQLDFDYGWYLDPIVYGDYPFIMKALVQERLPRFSKEESDMIKGSYDFIGINYYTSRYALGLPISSNDVPSSSGLDSYVDLKAEKDNIPIGKKMGTWVYAYPEGIRDLLVYTQQKYNNPPIYITENGTSELNNEKLKLEEVLDDQDRIRYYSSHLANVREAIKLGVNVKGYIAWSLMDSFEWNSGYSLRFGLAYVDNKDGLKRYPKASLKWFADFLKK